MKLAIMSDIHGNLEALNAVLEDQTKNRIESVVCLGDTIGYGGDPDLTIRKLMERRIPSVLGNHELAATDSRYLEWFNPVARESSLITHRLLSEEALNFMRQLKPSLELDALWFVHGFPPDSPTTYLYEVEDHQIISVVRQLNRDIIFIGHTHEPALIAWDGEKLSHHPLKRGTRRLDPQNRYMLNVGSVGQPRDGDHHAKYVIYDSNRHMIELRYVAYDIARAAQKIIAAGLPRQYAERLG